MPSKLCRGRSRYPHAALAVAPAEWSVAGGFHDMPPGQLGWYRGGARLRPWRDEGVFDWKNMQLVPDGAKTRPGASGDAHQVAGLWRRLVSLHEELNPGLPCLASDGSEQWERRLRALLQDPTFGLWVAEIPAEDRLVGFVTGFLEYWPPIFEPHKIGKIADLYVAPEWRRRGVARRLLENLSGWFREEKVDHLEVNMMTSNSSAVRFWRAVGGQELMMRMWLPAGGPDQAAVRPDGKEER